MAGTKTSNLRNLAFLFATICGILAVLSFAGNAGAVVRSGGTGTDPWISSDLPDYSPGSTVNLLGGSWQAGEAVHINVNDSDGQTWVFNDDVTADSNGDIGDSFSLPNWFVANYSVTATGAGGAVATSTFTDSQPQAATVASPTTVTVTQGDTASFGAVNVQVGGNGTNCTMTLSTVALAGDTGLPTGATASFGNSPVTTTVNFSSSLSVATTASVATGTYTFHVRVARGANCQGNGPIDATPQLTLTINSGCTAPAITANPTDQTITYGANATFTAAASGSPAPTVQWQVKIGAAAFTDIGGATNTTLTVTKPPVSSSGNQYRAVFTNTCGGTQTATTNAATLTVNRKAITITPDSGQSKVFGASDPTLTYANSPALESGDSFAGALGRAAGENVGNYAINLGTLSAGNNYTLTLSATTVNFAITPKPVTILPDSGQSKVYGSSDPIVNFTNDGGLASGVFTGALGRAAGEDVGSYALNLGNLSASNNYSLHLAATAVNFSITPRTLHVTADPQTKVYGADDPTLTYAVTLADLQYSDSAASVLSGALTRDPGETVAGGPYAIKKGTLAANGNYTLAFSGDSLTITPRPITVKAANVTRTYGESTPAFGLSVTAGSVAAGDSLSVLGTPAFTPEAGGTSTSGNRVVGSYQINVSGLENGNYLITYASSIGRGLLTIIKRNVAGNFTAADKVWDGGTSAVVTSRSLAPASSSSGKIAADDVALTGGTATFNTAAVDSNKTVTLSGGTLAGTDAGNYELNPMNTTTASITAWNAAGKGFYAPVGVANSIFSAASFPPPTTFNSTTMTWNTVKGGQTVPMKFNVFAGTAEKTGSDAFTNPATAFQYGKLPNCTNAADSDPVDYTTTATGSTTLRYDTTAMQWIYNWQTPKVSATTCYRTYVTFADGSSLEAFFQLGK